MNSGSPEPGYLRAFGLGILTFVAAGAGAYPLGLSPIAQGCLAGGFALVPVGFTLLGSRMRDLGIVFMVLGLVIAVAAGWQSRDHIIDGGWEAMAPGPDEPADDVAPPKRSPDADSPSKKSDSNPGDKSAAKPKPDSPTDDGGEAAPPSEPKSPHASSPGYVTLDIDGGVVSQQVPRIAAEVEQGYGGSQRVVISMWDLGSSTIEWDLEQPTGGTVIGTSMAAPADSMTIVEDLHPDDGGTYRLKIRNKDTGRASESTVELSADPRSPSVLQRSAGGSPKVSVVATEGKLCEGIRVSVRGTELGNAESVAISLDSGETAESGISPDAIGSDYVGFYLSSERCTGKPEKVGTLEVKGSDDQTIVTSSNLVVPN
ncbi:MAG: hypothetical protein ACRCYU_12050 [Nocardioides sp.]